MLENAIINLTKVVGFVLVSVCSIVVFYAAIHAVNINSQLDVFMSGLLMMLVGVVVAPLFCVIGAYGLTHYINVAPVGAWLLCIPILAAWCLLVVRIGVGYLRG